MTSSTSGKACPTTSYLERSNRAPMRHPRLTNTMCPVGTYLPSAASWIRTRDSRVSRRSRASAGLVSHPFFITVNSSAFPSGSQCGSRWEYSSLFQSGVVKLSGFPPSAETLERPAASPSVNTMLLSRGPQAAPNSHPVSHNVPGTPPSTGTFFNVPPVQSTDSLLDGGKGLVPSFEEVQNPTHLPSGDRKGMMPPSVPAIGADSERSILRRYNRGAALRLGSSSIAL